MDDFRIQELIDACRSGSEDLALPEMDELAALVQKDAGVRQRYQWNQKFDGVIRQVIDHLDPPDGLQERILASLGVGPDAVTKEVTSIEADDRERLHAALKVDSNEEQVDFPSDRIKSKSGGRGRVSRRTAVAVATAAVVLIALGVSWLLPNRVKSSDIANSAKDWAVPLMDPVGWKRDLSTAPWDVYPSPAGVNASIFAWRRTPTPQDTHSVVYRLGPLEDSRVPLVFVMRTNSKLVDAETEPPLKPNSDTGGFAVGVWKTTECMYALVVPGTAKNYGPLIRDTRQLAMAGF